MNSEEACRLLHIYDGIVQAEHHHYTMDQGGFVKMMEVCIHVSFLDMVQTIY